MQEVVLRMAFFPPDPPPNKISCFQRMAGFSHKNTFATGLSLRVTSLFTKQFFNLKVKFLYIYVPFSSPFPQNNTSGKVSQSLKMS
jgi:hypothetical protein